MQMRRLAELRLVRQTVAREERVRHHEADVAERQVVEQPPVRPVEKRERRERARPPRLDLTAQEAEAEAGVDDVVDEEDVLAARRAHRLPREARRLARTVRLEL